MEELKQEIGWLEEERSRLRKRYVKEIDESKGTIILTKLCDLLMMVVDLKYELSVLEKGL